MPEFKERLKQTMTFTKSTPGTHVYSSVNPDSPLPTQYLKKALFNGAPSGARIRVTVEIEE